jgi:phage terminase large subunit-like protein
MKAVVEKYAGTRLGRQELNAEMLDDVPGALWTRDMLDATRVKAAPELQRVIISVDPSGTAGAGSDNVGDDIGIIAAGIGVDGRGYVLGDYSCNLSPDGWGRRVREVYSLHKADRIVAERNFGGAMVEAVIKAQDKNLPVKVVTASRGKVARAEPIAAFYEQGRVSHIGGHADLEDQMCAMTPSGYVGDGSPDRADALVWALTELMLGKGYNYAAALDQAL